MNDQLHRIRISRDCSQGDVPLRIGLLQKGAAWWNILLRQGLHLFGVLFVFFLFLFDDVFFQAATAFGRLGWWIERGLLWLPIGSKANLEVLLLFLLPFVVDALARGAVAGIRRSRR